MINSILSLFFRLLPQIGLAFGHAKPGSLD